MDKLRWYGWMDNVLLTIKLHSRAGCSGGGSGLGNRCFSFFCFLLFADTNVLLRIALHCIEIPRMPLLLSYPMMTYPIVWFLQLSLQSYEASLTMSRKTGLDPNNAFSLILPAFMGTLIFLSLALPYSARGLERFAFTVCVLLS